MSTHHCLTGAGHDDTHRDIPNKAAPGVSYFTPAQEPPSGTAVDPQPSGAPIPKLFTPVTLRGLTLQNRILLSPLCQYSAQDGHHTPWHLTHLGGILQRGPGLTMIEATSVQARGRISPEDCGLWKDSQIPPLRATVAFAHSQGQKIGVQLAHAGRKASTIAPWLSGGSTATTAVGGWPDDVWAPSALPYKAGDFPCPKAMSVAQIEDFKKDFVSATKRAVEAGVDLVQIHAAHGYLLHEFLSPASNKRTDAYGGSFENRVRLTLEVVRLVRAAIPEAMPLGLRISATDWLDVEGAEYEGESWRLEDTVRIAPLLAEGGVDWLDVSTGGNHPAQKIKAGPGYQAPFAKAVKKAVGDKMAVSTVGMIENAMLAEELLEGRGTGEEGVALDMVAVGRGFQKNPGLVWDWADELGVDIHLANQIRWGFKGRRGGKK